jgi:hypothetical protein
MADEGQARSHASVSHAVAQHAKPSAEGYNIELRLKKANGASIKSTMLVFEKNGI